MYFEGMKIYETNEKELVMEPAIRWAGNPNIVLVLKLLSLRITIQVRKRKRIKFETQEILVFCVSLGRLIVFLPS